MARSKEARDCDLEIRDLKGHEYIAFVRPGRDKDDFCWFGLGLEKTIAVIANYSKFVKLAEELQRRKSARDKAKDAQAAEGKRARAPKDKPASIVSQAGNIVMTPNDIAAMIQAAVAAALAKPAPEPEPVEDTAPVPAFRQVG